MYIVIDGTDCAGKSTLIQSLQKRMEDLNLEVLTMRDPGGTPFGETIRNVVLDENFKDIEPTTQALLFTAGYHEALTKVIGPAVDAGKIVIGDRSNISTFAYQRKVPPRTLEKLLALNTDMLPPDISIILYTDYHAFSERLKARGEMNHYDLKTPLKHEQLVERYLTYAEDKPYSHVIDTSEMTEEEVYQEVIDILNDSALFGVKL